MCEGCIGEGWCVRGALGRVGVWVCMGMRRVSV